MSKQDSSLTPLNLQSLLKDISSRLFRIEEAIARNNDRTEDPRSHVLSKTLRVRFTFGSEGRKPCHLSIDGLTGFSDSMSPVRASIWLALLVDLQARSDGGSGYPSVFDLMVSIFRLLSNVEEGEAKLADAVRVALYRLEGDQPVSGFASVGAEHHLKFSRSRLQLSILDGSGRPCEGPFQIHISCDDPRIQAFVVNSRRLSPLEHVRRQGVLFLPGGPDGYDLLSLEFFDHPWPMKEFGFYYRPSTITYPQELLAAVKASEYVFERRKIALEGLKSGRCEFVDILERQTIWRMITAEDSGKYELYPSTVTKDLVLLHLNSLIYMLEHVPNYQMVLTNVMLPYMVSLCEIHRGTVHEYLTALYSHAYDEHPQYQSCVLMNDSATFNTFSEEVLPWVVSNASTIKDRAMVLAELAAAKNTLERQGPLMRTDLLAKLTEVNCNQR